MIEIKYKWKYSACHKENDTIVKHGLYGKRIWLDEQYDNLEEAMKALSDFLYQAGDFDEELILVTKAYSNHLA